MPLELLERESRKYSQVKDRVKIVCDHRCRNCSHSHLRARRVATSRIVAVTMPPQQNEEDQRKFDEFIVTLKNYHEKRGTLFDPEPRVSTKQIDLLQLYNAVLEKGGYDRVSEEKLAWRKLGQEFNLGTANLPALAFSLKTVYYKYLAAYEISTVHKKEPPPKEILEDLTAKGGALLSRTLENFRPSARKEGGALENSEASGDDGTPARDRNESEETPGSGGRVTRGLRQAPPQRILFQPDTQPSRQTRHASSTSHLPPAQQQQHQQSGPRGASTSYNPSSNMEHMSPAVANYEPRPQIPLTLRPVTTPGNNPVGFAKLQQALATKSATLSQPKVLLPGCEFTMLSIEKGPADAS
jgi:chromatin structure-remodeling complex subunit RSC9